MLIALLPAYSRDSITGEYYPEDQAEYDSEKRWIVISRNRYQEITVESESHGETVAFYDGEAGELFYVLDRPAQYDTLMKIRFVGNGRIELCALSSDRWVKSAYVFRRRGYGSTGRSPQGSGS